MWQKYNKPLLVMCPSVWESEFSVIGWLCSSHTNAEQVSTQKVFVQGLAWPGPPIPSLLLKIPRSTLAACWVQLQVSVSRLWPIIATYPFPPTLQACLWAYMNRPSRARALPVCLLPRSLSLRPRAQLRYTHRRLGITLLTLQPVNTHCSHALNNWDWSGNSRNR